MLLKHGIEQYLEPNYYKLYHSLFLAQFSVMKAVPAFHILKQAINNNQIDKNTTIVDSSSGTFALGLAMACNYFDLELKIVSDPAMSSTLVNRVTNLGAEVIIVDEPDESGNYQKHRLQRLNSIINETNNVFWCKQYHNPENSFAYAPLAKQLIDMFGTELVIIGSVGSGGSTSGVCQELTRLGAKFKLVAVDTFGSVLFGLEDRPRKLRGLGNSIIPQNLKKQYVNRVHWVSAENAFNNARNLHRAKGLFCGPTTAASILVAEEEYANSKGDIPHIVIGPDDGVIYLDSVYSDQWLIDNGFKIGNISKCSLEVKCLADIPKNENSWVSMIL
ncbi:MAG: N-(2-amino-2-carboxyethyl)-L-glutamate synthase [Candidatus Celerinatantimonas neptuna]|nr:MAG: N-(2-amino-2-carboxyethyl)-L-glutamate synthase [Candidatus Celerinatantimonas neptuna]